ncbi:PAS domain S-box protein [Marivirga sp.]|uniref:PAS domain S-box protein n=1 Tax=Marivirga sp. TaxID=2018662 RepID=UPI0025CFE610|nr:PAS domain S-box protein [Marivirga sp.]
MNFRPKKDKKTLVFAYAVSLIVALVFSITIIIIYEYYKKQKSQQLHSELNLVAEKIRKIMTNSNLAAFSIGLTVDPHHDTVLNFEYVAKEISEQHPYLYGVQILKKGKIQYVYPYDIHQSVIGFDILDNLTSKREAQHAIDKKGIYYAGPLDFKQGGKGIIGRLPIFHENEFWGFSAVLINMEDFLNFSGISDSKIENISFQFSKVNPNTSKLENFTPNKIKSNFFLDYTFEESGWIITAYYKQDFVVYLILLLVIFLALASSIGSGLFTYQLLKKPVELKSLLSDKTREIEENNEYLSSMVQAIPDLIFVYDKDARYLDFHAYQLSLLYYQPKEFIGKSTYELFDEEFAKNIHNAVKMALSSEKIMEYSYHLDINEERKYFESRYMAINSEKVLAVVREVTESKLSAEKLEKSEQKYRNLVSQASDAIFLSEGNGNLLELNQIGHEMTSISVDNDNIDTINLNDFIKLQDKPTQKLTDVIKEFGTTLEEAVLISRNGKYIPVEISCKITEERQIQGIIRDISPRKNFVKSIQKQNEKLKEIAWIQSHEVRAPLARLLGLLNFLENYHNISHIDKIKVIHSIRSSAEQLDIIIRDVVNRTQLAENAAHNREFN